MYLLHDNWTVWCTLQVPWYKGRISNFHTEFPCCKLMFMCTWSWLIGIVHVYCCMFVFYKVVQVHVWRRMLIRTSLILHPTNTLKKHIHMEVHLHKSSMCAEFILKVLKKSYMLGCKFMWCHVDTIASYG